MPVGSRRLPGLNPVTMQTLSLSNSTAQGLNSTAKGGTVICFSVETVDVRMRDDGTAPTNRAGVVFGVGAAPYFYAGDLDSVKFCRKGTTGTATVTLISYKQPGD